MKHTLNVLYTSLKNTPNQILSISEYYQSPNNSMHANIVYISALKKVCDCDQFGNVEMLFFFFTSKRWHDTKCLGTTDSAALTSQFPVM